MTWNISQARHLAHQAFDQLWLRKYMTRPEAYAWLARYLGVDDGEAHIANLDEVQCRALVRRAHEEVAVRASRFGQHEPLRATFGEVVNRARKV